LGLTFKKYTGAYTPVCTAPARLYRVVESVKMPHDAIVRQRVRDNDKITIP